MSQPAPQTETEKALHTPIRERTETDLNTASEAYHAHPSHPSTCEVYQAHYKRRCPCEDYQGEEGK